MQVSIGKGCGACAPYGDFTKRPQRNVENALIQAFLSVLPVIGSKRLQKVVFGVT